MVQMFSSERPLLIVSMLRVVCLHNMILFLEIMFWFKIFNFRHTSQNAISPLPFDQVTCDFCLMLGLELQ